MTIAIFMLLVLALLGLLRLAYRRWWDKGLTMDIGFSATEAFEGDSLVLKEDLTNEKLLPLPMLTAKFRLSRALVFDDEPEANVSDHYYRSDVFAVNVYQHIVRRQRFTCARRGYYRVEDMDLVSDGLFHDTVMVKSVQNNARLTVFPRLDYFEDMDIVYRQLMGEAEVRRFTNPDPFSFRGIRQYAPGDDFRSVNFRASAKSGELMVNIRAATASRQVVLVLDLEPYAAVVRDSVLEGSIRLAASAAAYFIGLGLTVGLVTNGADITTGQAITVPAGGGQPHLHSILTALARVDLGVEADPMAARVARLAATGGHGGAEPYYLLVAPYTGADLAESYAALYAQGGAARWLVPVAQLPQPAHPPAGVSPAAAASRPSAIVHSGQAHGALPFGAEYWEL